MKPPLFPTFARWLPALAVWSAVLLSLLLDGRQPARPTLTAGAPMPCTPSILPSAG